MELLVALAFFTLLAILGPWVGVDSRVPGGTPTDSRGQDLAGPPGPTRPTRQAAIIIS